MKKSEALDKLYPQPGDEPVSSLIERLEAHAVILKDGVMSPDPGVGQIRDALADLCLAFTMPKGFAARTMSDLCINEEDEELVAAALDWSATGHSLNALDPPDKAVAMRKLRNYAKTLRDLRAQRRERS